MRPGPLPSAVAQMPHIGRSSQVPPFDERVRMTCLGQRDTEPSATIERANIAIEIHADVVCHPDPNDVEVRSLRATTIPDRNGASHELAEVRV